MLTERQVRVLDAATARLIPGPDDDPGEAGHPGAREAGVVGYIDALLGALDGDPPRVFAGGPFSDRNGTSSDDMQRFVELDEHELVTWRARIAELRRRYAEGVDALDARAGGDFASASPARQDAVLAEDPGGFTALLMGHAIEGMYGNPEYGGNAALAGWDDIGFRGDTQPRGFTASEVSQSDGPDPLVIDGPVEAVLALMAFRAAAED
ncbi:MAG TPA: gluconate 2-dehydrogenase subunit 3 family protein [Acidimicrobiia bacterium]|nr:gluconate 2-dehydrogenase subunit 3 family protein [Acidimicrobiia bacterium]